MSSDWKQPHSTQPSEWDKDLSQSYHPEFQTRKDKLRFPEEHLKVTTRTWETDLRLPVIHAGQQKATDWTPLAVQWLTLCLPTQGTWVRSLSQQLDPTCCGTTKPMCQSYWSPSSRTHALQQEKPPQSEALHCKEDLVQPKNKRNNFLKGNGLIIF